MVGLDNMGGCCNSRFNKQVKINVAVLLYYTTHIESNSWLHLNAFISEMIIISCMVIMMFQIIWTANSLDSSGESDIFDNGVSSETIYSALESVWSENGQRSNSKLPFRFTGKHDISTRSAKWLWPCFEVYHV